MTLTLDASLSEENAWVGKFVCIPFNSIFLQNFYKKLNVSQQFKNSSTNFLAPDVLSDTPVKVIFRLIVVTLDQWGVALTRPVSRTAYLVDRVIQHRSRHFTFTLEPLGNYNILIFNSFSEIRVLSWGKTY